jgi:hypothetical protein
MWIAAAIAAIGIALVVGGMIAFRSVSEARGEDKEARKRLEEMARREQKARRIESRPTPSALARQLKRLRERLDRNRS